MNIGEYNKTIELESVNSSVDILQEMLEMSTDLVNIYSENVYNLNMKLDSISESYYNRNLYQTINEGKSETKKKGKTLVDKLNKQKEYLKNKLEKKKSSDKKDKKKLDDIKDKSKRVKLKESTIELSNYYTKEQIKSNTKLLESLSEKMDKTIIKYESVSYHDDYQKEKFVNETSDIKEKFDSTLSDILNIMKESSEYRLTHNMIEESIDTLKEEDLMYHNIRKDYTKAYMEMVTEANKEVNNGLGITELSNAKYDAANMKSSVLQWKIHMHENSLINAEKILEETSYLDEELMELYEDYMIDTDSYDFIQEGKNWDLYKNSRRYKKDFKQAMKKFKKANKTLDYNGAKSALKEAKATIDGLESELKYFDKSKSTEINGMVLGIFISVAKSFLYGLPFKAGITALRVGAGVNLGKAILSTFKTTNVSSIQDKSLLDLSNTVAITNNIFVIFKIFKGYYDSYKTSVDPRNKSVVSKRKQNPFNLNFYNIVEELGKLRRELDKMEKSLKKPGSVKESSDSWLSFE